MEMRRGYKKTEVGVIPEDWAVNAIGEMGDACAGKALAAWGSGHQRPYLRTKNVFDGHIDLDDVLSMPMTEVEFSRFRLQHGDVLLNEGQSLELVGRCAMYNGEYGEPCAIQNQLIRFRARDGVSANFAAHLFRYCQQSGVFAKIAMQTTSVAHLGVSRFNQLRRAWPVEEAEQEAIAEALSDADALIESLEQLLAKKRHLKQGAIQELLTGKKRLPGFSGEWEAKRLGELGTCLRGVSYRGDSDLSPCDTQSTKRLLRSNNVQDAAVVTTDIQFVNFERVSEKQLLREDDILICMANGSKALVGKAGLFKAGDGYEYTFGAFMGCFRSYSDESNATFVFYLLQTGRYRKYINDLLAGSSINNLTPSSIESLEFLIPPLPEQTAITAILSDMDAEIAALETKLAKARKVKQGMMQELLTGRIRLV